MKKTLLGLSVAIFFQFIVLSGMYVSAAMPLWTGTEIKVKTIPVDPRSMFRGNYARLTYDFSLLKSDLLPDSEELRNGEVVYILLKPGDEGLHEFSKVMLRKPAQGPYLRGRIENRQYEVDAYSFRVKYGIEAFFAPKEKALALEKDLRDGGVAVLMVSAGGKARLKNIEE
jgi:uncharacterized membrane-anchored protein